MGVTNSHSLNHKGNSLPVLSKNSYHLHALSSPASLLNPRIITITNMSKQRYEQWQSSLKHLQRYNQYLQLPKQLVWKVDCLCSDYGLLEIQYQDGIYTLNQEIEYRSLRQQYFQEYELWYMLFLIITLQFNLNQDLKKEFWNIHPESILITQLGHMKIIIEPESQEGKRMQQFVPPEEIPLLLLKLIKTTDERVMMRINKDISETFQLGLTLLSAAQLNNYQFLYSHTPLLALDVDRLKEELDRCTLSGRYTEVLTALIANLCSFNPAQRLSGPELWQWVTDHSVEIKQRGTFNFKYLPKKISALVAMRMKDNQQDLLRNSRLKMEKLSSSQVAYKEQKTLQRNPIFQKHLYQPIHQIGKHAPPKHNTRN